MRRRCSFGICLVVVIGLSAINHAGQTDRAIADEWWINLASSPLRITRTASGRVVTVSNFSSGSINQYQLGCVTKEAGKLRVKRKMKAQITNLQPVDAVKGEVYFESLDLREKYQELCGKENAKLAVIKVTFIDGSVWKVNH